MSRRSARTNAFYLLFQMDFNREDEYEQVKQIFFAEKEEPVTEEDKQFILQEVEGTKENMAEIDQLIGKCAKSWDTDRMSKVDLAILRLAVYEIKYSEATPVGVAINEAVELAKKFSSDEAPSFINGILGKIAKDEMD
ncbi:MAG: transcription antitermination factor NusB [Epulopiscium sp.]|jgi:N utilization substance protein B|nr:transcription antitermination factor NusB [Candidatus Epulonipiscium sp.]